MQTDISRSELIYPRNIPSDARTNVPKPSQFGITDYEDLQIPTPDGESLNALFIRPSNKRLAKDITVLMFHGNAGNIGHRIPIAQVLEETLGCNVLMLEYRGYGLSTGTPDEVGLTIDAQTGLDYIRQRVETRDTKIVVYGQSLGGAVAINLVANNQQHGDIAGLILENTFLSIRKMIPAYVFHVRSKTPSGLSTDTFQSLPAGSIPRTAMSPVLGKRGHTPQDHGCPHPLPQRIEG